jgi:hypothetical protein
MNNRDLAFELKKDIEHDERVIWAGRPKQGFILRSSDAFMIPFSLMWGGFAFFWEITVIKTGAPLLFTLFGLPFVLIGLYLIFGRFIYDAETRKATVYGITEKRIIIKSKKTVKSINIQSITNITLTEKPDGSGTIVLGSNQGFNGNMPIQGTSIKMNPTLEMVHDVRTVYRHITGLQKK